MTLTVAQSARQSQLTAFSTSFGATAQLTIHSGSAPTDADTALSSNPIAVGLPYTVTTPFGAPTAAKPSVMTAATITTTNVYGTATATFFRSWATGTGGYTGATFVVNSTYMIQALGTTTLTNWQTVGLNASLTSSAVGQLFVATATTLAGSGTAYVMNCIEQGSVGTSGASPDLTLNTTSLVAAGPLQITSLTRSF